jgi:hypothetical protein
VAAAPDRVQSRLFLIALERGFLDSVLDRLVVAPFTRAARLLTRLDQRLSGAVLAAAPPAAIGGVEQDE